MQSSSMSALLNASVPVRLDHSWGGFARNSGLLRLEGDALVLEFETKDEFLQVLKSGVKRVAVPLTEVESCGWKPGWFSSKIELSVRSMNSLRDIAGASQGRVVMRVSRRDKDKAFGLVANVEMALATRVVRAADESGRA